MNPVTDLHDTRARNQCQKNGVDLWCQFLERVSWALDFLSSVSSVDMMLCVSLMPCFCRHVEPRSCLSSHTHTHIAHTDHLVIVFLVNPGYLLSRWFSLYGLSSRQKCFLLSYVVWASVVKIEWIGSEKHFVSVWRRLIMTWLYIVIIMGGLTAWLKLMKVHVWCCHSSTLLYFLLQMMTLHWMLC